MAKKFSIEKIQKEIDRIESTDDLVAAYNEIKKYMTQKLLEQQKKAEEEANNLQSQIQKINGS